MRTSPWRCVAIGMIGALGMTALAAGQAAPAPRGGAAVGAQPPTTDGSVLRFTVGVGVEHQFDTGVDGPGDGEFDVTRFAGLIGIGTNLNEDLQLSLRFGYGLNAYDFSGPTLGVDDPWDDIHIAGAAAILTADMTDEFSIFGGAVAQVERETGADWGDSIIGGGVFGGTYRLSEDLTLGGGVGVVSQIEDNARVFPIIIVDWRITETLRLSTEASTNASGRTGLELIWKPNDQWEFALGGANEFSRFRLDEDGDVPDGVGEDESLPIWFRATWSVQKNCRITGMAGFTMRGELTLEDDDGDQIAEEDYDTAPFIGLFANIRF